MVGTLEKCSNQHAEIFWDWTNNLVLSCPICAIRRESKYRINNDVEEKESEIQDLKREIENLEEEICQNDGKIKDLRWRIENSVLGQLDKLVEEIAEKEGIIRKKEIEKEDIMIEKDKVIRKREKELKGLERRVVPAHIPYEQYEKFLEEQRRR